jgi:hypothetical protein
MQLVFFQCMSLQELVWGECVSATYCSSEVLISRKPHLLDVGVASPVALVPAFVCPSVSLS